MEPTKANYDNVLIEHTFFYLRECHGHLHSLTRSVVSLNVAVLAFGALFIRLADDLSFLISDLASVGLIIFGVLVTLFGVVFNQGAKRSFLHLVEVIDDSKEFLEKMVEETLTSKLFFDNVLKNERGRLFRLTNLFFLLCSLIWVFYGVAIIVYGIEALRC